MKNKIYSTVMEKKLVLLPWAGHYSNIEKLLQLNNEPVLPELVFITSYPPRECGIATYSFDLLNAIREKFGHSFSLQVAALDVPGEMYSYKDEVKYRLLSTQPEQYDALANQLNADDNVKMIFLQHEFGLYGGLYGEYLLRFLSLLQKPVITTFHTVLPEPDGERKKIVQSIIDHSSAVVAMTNNAEAILKNVYDAPASKIAVIPHGTHLVPPPQSGEEKMKRKFGNRFVLSTFGLLGAGKSIETALDALPAIVAQFPNVLYLVIGKTHPGITKNEGEQYREMLHQKVIDLKLENHVQFINKYVSLQELLGYLQRTDIYLFTSKDPHQAVSGTFAYAMSCGCPVISTPIPHAVELLDGAGIIFDFQNAEQLAAATLQLLADPLLLQQMKLNALHKISPTAWQNAAIAHVALMQKNSTAKHIPLQYSLPDISLTHIQRLTTPMGMLQFAAIAVPDIQSGYTVDDNARALIAAVKHYALTGNHSSLQLATIYLDFLLYCQQPQGNFTNYVDEAGNFFEKNNEENLEDSNGRAIWALGEMIAARHLFNKTVVDKAAAAIERSFSGIKKMHSPRAMAFSIKGLHQYNTVYHDAGVTQLIILLADNLVSKYRGVSDTGWQWFEEYLTYANSVLPEAMLYAYLDTGSLLYKNIAVSTFNFLLSVIFKAGKIKVVSNQGWHIKGAPVNAFGEQPIDVAYTILALGLFYDVFKEQRFLATMETAFSWFLGNNHLQQVIYNPCTGGCYDGLEEHHINLNQGAESTVSYLLARLTVEKYLHPERLPVLPMPPAIRTMHLGVVVSGE